MHYSTSLALDTFYFVWSKIILSLTLSNQNKETFAADINK
jgi:hypothetical protein